MKILHESNYVPYCYRAEPGIISNSWIINISNSQINIAFSVYSESWLQNQISNKEINSPYYMIR